MGEIGNASRSFAKDYRSGFLGAVQRRLGNCARSLAVSMAGPMSAPIGFWEPSLAVLLTITTLLGAAPAPTTVSGNMVVGVAAPA